MAEQTVSLNPGESKVVSFSVVPSQAKTYQVQVNGLQGSFVASEALPAEFVYTSDLILVRTDQPTLYDISWEVSVKNIGAGAGLLHLTIANRMDYACDAYEFSGWKATVVQDTIAPGETKTFSGGMKLSPYCYEIKAESEAGLISKYWRAASA